MHISFASIPLLLVLGACNDVQPVERQVPLILTDPLVAQLTAEDLKSGMEITGVDVSGNTETIKVTAKALRDAPASITPLGLLNAMQDGNSIPGFWVSPSDGCTHLIVDSGAQGFMTPALDNAGNILCG